MTEKITKGTANVQEIYFKIGNVTLRGRLEEERAPQSCELFRTLMSKEHHVIHCRWSGESLWIPFPQPIEPLMNENATSHPLPGQMLIYAGPLSEPEILIPYGECVFNSKVGVLSGNHFLTLDLGREHLETLGRKVLWFGAQNVKVGVDLP